MKEERQQKRDIGRREKVEFESKRNYCHGLYFQIPWQVSFDGSK